MLNRWIKPNEDLDIIISRHVMKKYELQPWSTEVVVHSFMMYADGFLLNLMQRFDMIMARSKLNSKEAFCNVYL